MTPLEEIAHIANVPIELEVQLDRRFMKISEILSLEEGRVIVRDGKIGGGKHRYLYWVRRLAAFGEIVIIENIMGVRIMDFNIER